MKSQNLLGRRDDLTFKGNLNAGRFGWLRLTPAYSVHLVADLLTSQLRNEGTVLDPFCGTGTTALLCAERDIRCDTCDINPFLVWLAQAKTRPYSTDDLAAFRRASSDVAESIGKSRQLNLWTPAIHQIEKWWDPETLQALGRAMGTIDTARVTEPVAALLKIAFCRVLINCAHVTFGHQSMSFRRRQQMTLFSALSEAEQVANLWEESKSVIARSAASAINQVPGVLLLDSRHLDAKLPLDRYSVVVTSPPYPNRMSYIRELRPYMYWLGFLENGRAAGELDWHSIGGTWGCATSNLAKWQPDRGREITHHAFRTILKKIARHSEVLSRYVEKYFHDMTTHSESLFRVMKSDGVLSYVVGNSKFYDVLLPVEHIFADIFKAAGFQDVAIRKIRKRTSKRELFEFVVSARKP